MGLPRTATSQYYNSINTMTIGGYTFMPTGSTNKMVVFNNDPSLRDGITGPDQVNVYLEKKAFAPGYDVHGDVVFRDDTGNVFSSLDQLGGITTSSFNGLYWALWVHGEGANELILPYVEWSGSITNVMVVPEPGTWALISVGLAVIGFCARRRPPVARAPHSPPGSQALST
jgi:hypothetical protein